MTADNGELRSYRDVLQPERAARLAVGAAGADTSHVLLMVDDDGLVVAGAEGEVPNLLESVVVLLQKCPRVGSAAAVLVSLVSLVPSAQPSEDALREVFADRGVELLAWLRLHGGEVE